MDLQQVGASPGPPSVPSLTPGSEAGQGFLPALLPVLSVVPGEWDHLESCNNGLSIRPTLMESDVIGLGCRPSFRDFEKLPGGSNVQPRQNLGPGAGLNTNGRVTCVSAGGEGAEGYPGARQSRLSIPSTNGYASIRSALCCPVRLINSQLKQLSNVLTLSVNNF